MVTEAFATFKSRLELNPSFDEKIKNRHNAVRSAVSNIETGIDTKLIGSLARKTRIQPRPSDIFDIDILVIRGSFNQWLTTGGLTADAAIASFLQTIQKSERYAAKSPSPDKPTISIPYEDDTKVELVPAYRDNIGRYSDGGIYTPKGRAYWVPKSSGWELADYDYDAKYVSDKNAESGGWLIPVIKMLKALRRRYFADVPSFFFEMLVIKLVAEVIVPAYQSSKATITYPVLIQNFFKLAGGWLNFSMSFPGSLTKPVSVPPVVQQSTKEIFETIRSYCEAIDKTSSETEQQKMWRRLFDDPFPSV